LREGELFKVQSLKFRGTGLRYYEQGGGSVELGSRNWDDVQGLEVEEQGSHERKNLGKIGLREWKLR
jgi:hypothetical protein